MGPVNVVANATSSTTVVVSWGDVPPEHRNGIIEGFKVISFFFLFYFYFIQIIYSLGLL